jgi:hypothetical protein
VEMIYAGSRNEVGGGKLAGRGGSHGDWAADYLTRWGVLHRRQYSSGSETIDLSGYHPGRSRQYRDVGVPDWLEPEARKHPLLVKSRVTTGAEAIDAVCAGQVVLICSSYAISDTRDAQGFSEPILGWSRAQWWHCMLLSGAVLSGPKTGGVVQNSAGVWNSGPRPRDMPEGSFAIETHYLDMMVRDWGDCWALSSYRGSESDRIRHRLYR